MPEYGRYVVLSLFAFLLIVYLLTNKDKRKSDIFKGIFTAGIVLSIVGSILDFSSIPGIFLFAAFLFWMSKKSKKSGSSQWDKDGQSESERYRQWREATSKNSSQRQNPYTQNSTQSGRGSFAQSGSWEQSWDGADTYTDPKKSRRAAKVTSAILPRTVKKRVKIVENFSRRFELGLTDAEIKRIVDASYLSDAWKREVEAMAGDYATEVEWFNGVTGWLRVYLYVFRIQNVSSDFPRQLQICDETFDEVMRYAESLQYATLDEKIEKVNQRFFTRFDEATFMIAYRFMEKRGRKYDLDRIQVLKNEKDYEEAARKYDQMESGWKEDGQTGQARMY